MKYTPHQYANALLEALEQLPEEECDAALSRFVALVRKNKDTARWNDIVQAVEDQIIYRRGGRRIVLAFAHAHPSYTEALRGLFNKEDELTVEEKPELGAGVRITIDRERELDATLAGRLRRMFPNASLSAS